MERYLIEEIATMKGGMGRLDQIQERLRTERAAVTQRERELNELIELCVQLRNANRGSGDEPTDSIGE